MMPWGSSRGSVLTLACAIHNIGVIGRAIPSNGTAEIPFPTELRNHMENFRFLLDQNIPAGIPTLNLFSGCDEEAVIDANLKLAWHIGAFLYYQNCVNKLFGHPDIRCMDSTILGCLHRVEDIKELIQPDITMREEPVTWPAFVASCNASTARPAWQQWWERISGYGNVNINRQWSLIQIVWATADIIGDRRFDWVSFLEGVPGEDEEIIPLDYLIERLHEDFLDEDFDRLPSGAFYAVYQSSLPSTWD